MEYRDHRTGSGGFSLVELSIVLVILGLLIGGILSGRALIRSAELRSVTQQYEQFVTASYAFRNKYMALPGDFTQAAAFWGAAATGADCLTVGGTGTATCNGNGNGVIDLWVNSNEIFRFWQHLSNAALIEGVYSGVHIGAQYSGTTRENAPAGKINTSLWFVQYMGVQSGNAVWFDGNYGNAFEFGGQFADYDPATPILLPSEAWNIDGKIDDGKPAMGKVVVRAQNGLNTCTTASTSSALNADYLLDSSEQSCGLFFRQAL